MERIRKVGKPLKAYVHSGESGVAGAALVDHQRSSVRPGEVRVKLKTAGLNRRDLRVMNLRRAGDPPFVLGSDGAGIVEEVAPGITNVRVGDEVIIHPGLGWLEKSPAPPSDYQILGSPSDGTFAESIVLSGNHVVPKPQNLSWDEAGVLSLAGVTAYRALFTRAQVKVNQTVLIPGIGGGVALFLLQFAKAAGATVIVTSRSEEKRRKAREFGADVAIDTSRDWRAQLGGATADVVIDSIGGPTLKKCLDVLKPGGTLVTFGATTDDVVEIDIRSFFYGQYNLLGTTLGSLEEHKEMVSFVEKYSIRPVIDRMYSFNEVSAALRRLQDSENFGKIGLRVD